VTTNIDVHCFGSYAHTKSLKAAKSPLSFDSFLHAEFVTYQPHIYSSALSCPISKSFARFAISKQGVTHMYS